MNKVTIGVGLVLLAGALAFVGIVYYNQVQAANQTAAKAVQGTSGINALAGQASNLLSQLGLAPTVTGAS